MLIGSTFAWFTDTASTGVNKIQAGNLDIEVDYSKDGTTWASIEDATTLFSNNLWEPGHTEYVYLRVKNAGTLSLKYKVMVTPVSENGGINVYDNNFKLSDYLKFGTTTPSASNTAFTNRDDARNAVTATATGLTQTDLTKESTINAGAAAQYITLVVYMPETVDNNANAKPGTTAPSIDLGIKVVATQVENESDSFGNDYDADAGAENGSEYIAGPFYDYFQQVNLSQTVSTTGTFTLSTNNEATVSPTNTVIVTGQANNGATVNVTVNKTSTPAGVTVEENRSAIAYNVNVTGQADGSIVTVKLYVGTGLSRIKFFHTKSSGTIEMEKVNALVDSDVDRFTYDETTGVLTFKATEFSPFTGVFDDAVAAITNENGTAVYGTLDAAIKAANSGATITLLKDSVGKGIGSADGNKARESLTIDFNGHTYTMLNPAVGSSGTETQAMHWGTFLGAITLKNGTFKVDENASEVGMAMQNYIDFTADNMTFDFTNIPVDFYGDWSGTKYEAYSNLEVPMFNNNSGKMVLKNSTIIMPNDSTKGISSDGDGVDIISCTIYGAINLQDQNSIVRIKNSIVSKEIVSYFNNGSYKIISTTDNEGYDVYRLVGTPTEEQYSFIEQVAYAIYYAQYNVTGVEEIDEDVVFNTDSFELEGVAYELHGKLIQVDDNTVIIDLWKDTKIGDSNYSILVAIVFDDVTETEINYVNIQEISTSENN